jgi:hypothetical protein
VAERVAPRLGPDGETVRARGYGDLLEKLTSCGVEDVYD